MRVKAESAFLMKLGVEFDEVIDRAVQIEPR